MYKCQKMNSSSLIYFFYDHEHVPGRCFLVWQYTGRLQTYTKSIITETLHDCIHTYRRESSRPFFEPPPHLPDLSGKENQRWWLKYLLQKRFGRKE